MEQLASDPQAIHHVDGLVEAWKASSGKGALKATRYQEFNNDDDARDQVKLPHSIYAHFGSRIK